jgi:hypothetical protein
MRRHFTMAGLPDKSQRLQRWDSTLTRMTRWEYLDKPLIIVFLRFKSEKQQKKQTLWPESASKLYRPSDRRLSAKSVSTFAERGCRVVSTTDPHGCILGFLDRNCYYFFQVASQLHSQGWVDPKHQLAPVYIYNLQRTLLIPPSKKKYSRRRGRCRMNSSYSSSERSINRPSNLADVSSILGAVNSISTTHTKLKNGTPYSNLGSGHW